MKEWKKNFVYTRPGKKAYFSTVSHYQNVIDRHPRASAEQIQYWGRGAGRLLSIKRIKALQKGIRLPPPEPPEPPEPPLWGVHGQINHGVVDTGKQGNQTLGYFYTSKRYVRALTREGAISMVRDEILEELREAYQSTDYQIKLPWGRSTKGSYGSYEHPLIDAQEIDAEDAPYWTTEGKAMAVFAKKIGDQRQQCWDMWTEQRQTTMDDYIGRLKK